MAHFRDRFSTGTAGTVPTGWVATYALGANWGLVHDPGLPWFDGKGLGYDSPGGLNGLYWTAAGTANDWNVLLRFRFDATGSGIRAGVVLRTTTSTAGAAVGYRCVVYGDTDAGAGRFQIERAGGTNIGGASPFVPAVDTDYLMRAECTGTTIRMRVFPDDGSAEPVGWDVSVVDATYANGGIALVGQNTVATTLYDAIAAGTAGTVAVLDNPPNAPALTAPLAGAQVYGPQLEAEWTASTDADGDAITYDLHLSTDGGATYPNVLATGQAGTTWSGDVTSHAGTNIKLRVRASAYGISSAWVESGVFTIAAPVGPRWDLTFFDPAGEPLFGVMDGDEILVPSFSTDPGHPRAWLDWPEGAGSEVDFREGKAKIGQFNVTLADKRSVATNQATGQITAILGDYQGLNGLRARLTYTDASDVTVVAIDGPLSDARMHSSFAGYSWSIKDENIKTRKVRAFDRNGTVCVFPRGPVEPYGLLPSGKYHVPAAPTIRGTYDGDATQGVIEINGSLATEWMRVLTQAMADAVRFDWDESVKQYVMKNAKVRWRPAAGGAWTEIVDMPQYQRTISLGSLSSIRARDLFDSIRRDKLRFHDSSGAAVNYDDVQYITGVRLRTGGGALPTNGQSVDFQVIYTGPASKAYPVVGDGTAGDFLAAAYDGDFCTDPLDIRYDDAVVAAFEQPCSYRITEPTDDLLAWLEKHWYQPLAAAPCIDADGRISPRRHILPDENTALLTLDDVAVVAEADWGHSDSGVINEASFTYFRDVLVDPRDDPTGEVSAGDGVWAREIRVERVEDSAGPSHTRFGVKKHEIKTELFRALGNPDGTSAAGEATSEIGHIIGKERGFQALDRYLFGAPAFPLRTRRSVTGDLQLGDWVEVGVSHLPDYISGLRGMNRVAQVLGIDDGDPVTRTLMVEDGGDALAPLAQPTVGAAAENADGGITLPVTAVIAGTYALVEYAISATQPLHDSALWLPAGRIDAAGDVATPQLPAGVSVWVGARSFAPNRRPSLRTTPAQVIMAETPRVTQVKVAVADDGTATVRWEPNAFTGGVRVYWEMLATEDVPTLPNSIDADAGDLDLVLPDTALIGQLVTAEVEPYEGWTGAAVSGAAGPSVTAYGGLGVGPVIKDASLTDLADGRIQLDLSLSGTVTRWEVWRRPGASPKVGGVPLEIYSVGRHKREDVQKVWSVSNATHHVLVRAFDDEGQMAEWEDTIVSTGGGGDDPESDVPSAPILSLGVAGGGFQNVHASWVNPNTGSDIEYQWAENSVEGAVGGPLAAGTSTHFDLFPVDSAVKLRTRYIDGIGGQGPWSSWSASIDVTG